MHEHRTWSFKTGGHVAGLRGRQVQLSFDDDGVIMIRSFCPIQIIMAKWNESIDNWLSQHKHWIYRTNIAVWTEPNDFSMEDKLVSDWHSPWVTGHVSGWLAFVLRPWPFTHQPNQYHHILSYPFVHKKGGQRPLKWVSRGLWHSHCCRVKMHHNELASRVVEHRSVRPSFCVFAVICAWVHVWFLFLGNLLTCSPVRETHPRLFLSV